MVAQLAAGEVSTGSSMKELSVLMARYSDRPEHGAKLTLTPGEAKGLAYQATLSPPASGGGPVGKGGSQRVTIGDPP
jgi:hypothetical protein